MCLKKKIPKPKPNPNKPKTTQQKNPNQAPKLERSNVNPSALLQFHFHSFASQPDVHYEKPQLTKDAKFKYKKMNALKLGQRVKNYNEHIQTRVWTFWTGLHISQNALIKG